AVAYAWPATNAAYITGPFPAVRSRSSLRTNFCNADDGGFWLATLAEKTNSIATKTLRTSPPYGLVTSRLAFPAAAPHHDHDAVVLAPVVRAIDAERVRARRACVLHIEPRREMPLLGPVQWHGI